MEKYFCPKIQRELDVSEKSYELCSDCRESKIPKMFRSRFVEGRAKTEIIGKAVFCYYNNRKVLIPNPSQQILDGLIAALV